MTDNADPHAEEQQLLTQLLRATGPVMITHSATLAILDRLEAREHACSWGDADFRVWADITATGRKALAPAETDAAFTLWRDSLPPTHWARHDISACRLGFDAGWAAAKSKAG